VEVARICGLEADFTAAKRRLANLEDPWLLIIDNADNPQLDVLRYFPTGDRGTILLTTRNPDCKVHATSGSFEIREMELEDAITLLLRTTEAEDVFDAASRSLAKPVVETLGCLALAIVHAGAVIRQGLCNMEEYCGTYSRRRKALLSRLPLQTSSDYKYTVYTTFEISFTMIESMSDDTSRNAIEILQLFCFFHHDGISEDILKQVWKNMRNGQGTDWIWSLQLGVLRQDTSQEWDPYLIREAINLLSSFSLLTVSRSGDRILVQSHPLVHAWARDKMDETEQKRCWLKAASTLAMSIKWDVDLLDDQHQRSLVPHLDSCLVLRVDELFVEENARERLHMAITFADVYDHAFRWQRALELQERVVEGLRNACGEEDAQTLIALSTLGNYYQKVGEAQKGLGILEQVLSTQRRIVGEEDPNILYTKISLAACYFYLGQHHNSINLCEETVEIMTRLWGNENRWPLGVTGCLADSYAALGQEQKAIELQERVLEIQRRVLGEEHPETLSSTRRLAFDYAKMGQVQSASELQEKTLEIERRVLGEDHSQTLLSMTMLALSYVKLGQVQKAMELEEKTLSSERRVLGEEHPHTLISMRNLECSYDMLDQVQKAMELREKMLDLRRTLGEEHADTLETMHALGGNYSEVGQVQKAMELREKMLDLRRRTLGEEHPDTLETMHALGGNYSEVGQVQKAMELQEKTLQIRRRVLGQEHPDTLSTMEGLGHSYYKLGQMQKAVELGEKTLQIRRRLRGEEAISTLGSIQNLAGCYHKLGHVEEVIRLCDRGLEISMRTLGEQHPRTVRFRKCLAYYRQDSAPSQEVSRPDPLSQITTDSPLNVRSLKSGHLQRLLVKLRLSRGSK